MKSLAGVIAKLTEKGEQFAASTFVGPGYSKADLLADLRAVQAFRQSEYADLTQNGCGYVECGMRIDKRN